MTFTGTLATIIARYRAPRRAVPACAEAASPPDLLLSLVLGALLALALAAAVLIAAAALRQSWIALVAFPCAVAMPVAVHAFQILTGSRWSSKHHRMTGSAAARRHHAARGHGSRAARAGMRAERRLLPRSA